MPGVSSTALGLYPVPLGKWSLVPPGPSEATQGPGVLGRTASLSHCIKGTLRCQAGHQDLQDRWLWLLSTHPIQRLEKGCYLETRGLLGGKVPDSGEEAHGKCSYSTTLLCQRPVTGPQPEGYALSFFRGSPGLDSQDLPASQAAYGVGRK